MKVRGKLTFLFLGGAKRVAIARRFIEACRRQGLEAEILGYELDAFCPLSAVGKIVEGRRWSDPEIFEHLDSVVDEYGVDAIIPFVDGAVGIAAGYRDKYSHSGVYVPVGDRKMAETMFDKCAAAELFENIGVPVPATYRQGDMKMKLIAKPRFGSASKGIVEINSLQKLFELRSQGEKYLIQERIDHREELTVDCYASVVDGSVCAVSPRVRLEVSGGEVVRTITVEDAAAVALAKKTIERTGLRGAVTVQLIRDIDDGRLMVMEVNPRLGGGAPASINAGIDIPAMIVDEILGKVPVPMMAKAGVLTVRYLEDIAFYPEEE